MLRSVSQFARVTRRAPTLVKATPIQHTALLTLPRAPLARSYHERVIDHYEKPRNVGSLNRQAANVGTGVVGAPACGDVMKLQIQVNEQTGVIEEAVFKTFGCGSAIASSSLATEWVKGKTLEEASAITNNEIATYLSLPPVKKHCSMLAEDAIKAAVRDLLDKREKGKTASA
ncbi:iron sulfur cluster assembly protein, mitochondrial precursor [Planoprotostelium fungivorum]|uniref:Iron-sulfur cluster assembly protein n=1 Tax=Planoprotostelium fungivorum TaxID=1890364 RepID=A0A2P6NT23_9EUKA|nr:iron sulfur cluster assembly protein, mitochondrial precursor [Planoprotostelium fungivorum]